MSKTQTSQLRVRRSILASAAAMALGVAAPALADSWSNSYYSFGQHRGVAEQTLSLRDYVMAVTVPQINSGHLSALAADVRHQALLSGPAGYGTPVAMTGNHVGALVAGNQSTSSKDLGLLAQGSQGADGLGILTGQVRRDAASRALVTGSSVAVRLQNLPSADQAVTGNTLSARTTLNESDATVSGTPASAYPSGRQGAISTGMDLDSGGGHHFRGGHRGERASVDMESNGSVTVGTAQVATDAGARAGSGASLRDSHVTLEVRSHGFEGHSAIDSQLSMTDNELSAQYAANRSSNVFQSNGTNAFAGSVAVHNAQASVERSRFGHHGDDAAARVTGTEVRVDVGGIKGQTTLTGGIAITGNRIVGSATGNAALAGGLAGNAIDITGASHVAGSGSGSWNQVGVEGGSAYAEVAADLALSNVQGNRGARLRTEMAENSVTARAGGIGQSAAVALNDNAVAASATANTAGNRIAVEGTTVSATAAAANAQVNQRTDVVATNQAAQVDLQAGSRYSELSGATTLAGNVLSASASGNVADTQVALSASQLANGHQPEGLGFYSESPGMGGAASANNAQVNQGGVISAALASASVNANFADHGHALFGSGSLGDASVALQGNALRAQAVGNDASTGVALAATAANTSAAAMNAQTNASQVAAVVSHSGAGVNASRVNGSSISLDGNTVAAGAVANRADTRVSGRFGTLESGNQWGNEGYGAANAQFGLASVQQNAEGVVSSNTSGTAGAVRVTGGYWPGIGYGGGNDGKALNGSQVAVTNSTASASSTGNQAANTLAVAAGQVTAGNGIGEGKGYYGYVTPMAALTNVQSGWTESRSSATVATGHHGLAAGVEFEGAISSSSIAVTGNTVAAANLGNTAANRVEASGTQFVRQGGAVQTDFALMNLQTDAGAGRSATTRNATIGVQDTGWSYGGGMHGTDVTVSDNRNLAEARNNNAANSVSLAGFSSLATGASVVNTQNSAAKATAEAEGEMRLRVRDMGVDGSTLSLADNATQAMAIANSADNGLAVQATALQGNAYGPVSNGFSANSPGMTAGFAVGNVQSSGNKVEAAATASNRIDLGSSGAFGTTAAVSGNTVAGIAQGNSANNALSLAATTAAGLSGAVNSVQDASGAVRAKAEAGSADSAFAVQAGYAFGAQLAVTGNKLTASAGQNEAFNQQTVTATSITPPAGLSFGGYSQVYDSEMPSTGDFSVSNQQTGSGNVRATALPGQIGIAAGSVYSGSLAVTGNEVNAKANVNTASNALTLAAGAALGSGGTVSNTQSTGHGPVIATVGSHHAATLVGATAGALNGAAAVVTGNALNAVASGNQGVNALNATGHAAQGGAQGFAVLNTQANAAAMNAAVRNASIGISSNGMHYEGNGFGMGGGFTGASGSVLSNSVQATGYGNNASNAISLSAPEAGRAGATANLVNRQTNTGNINAMVHGVTIGLSANGAHGSTGVVSGNNVSAQAIGNSAVNAISVK